jgi:hypothetical protein
MREQEYLSKMERLDTETKERFNKMFGNIYTRFHGLSYSKAELFIEDLKRTLKKDSSCHCQLWEKGYEPTV